MDQEGLSGRRGRLHIRSSSKTARRECHAHPTSLTLFASPNNTNRAAVCALCGQCTYYVCIYKNSGRCRRHEDGCRRGVHELNKVWTGGVHGLSRGLVCAS